MQFWKINTLYNILYNTVKLLFYPSPFIRFYNRSKKYGFMSRSFLLFRYGINVQYMYCELYIHNLGYLYPVTVK